MSTIQNKKNTLDSLDTDSLEYIAVATWFDAYPSCKRPMIITLYDTPEQDEYIVHWTISLSKETITANFEAIKDGKVKSTDDIITWSVEFDRMEIDQYDDLEFD